MRAVRSCNQPSARSTPWCAREDRAGRRAAQSRVRVRPKPSGGRVEHTDCKSRRSLSCFVSTGLRGLSGGREVAERGAADSLSSLHEVQPPVRFTPRVRKRSTRGTQGCEIQTLSIVSVCTKRSIVNLDFELCTGVLSGAVWLSGGAANRLAERNSSSAPSTLPLRPDEK